MALNRKAKTQPLAKTLLTEFTCTLADVHLRRRMAGGSIAKRVSETSSFASGDETCGPQDDQAFVIENVQTGVVIQSYSDLMLDITHGDTTLAAVPCSGLFIHYGKIDRIVIRSAAPTRFSYIRS